MYVIVIPSLAYIYTRLVKSILRSVRPIRNQSNAFRYITVGNNNKDYAVCNKGVWKDIGFRGDISCYKGNLLSLSLSMSPFVCMCLSLSVFFYLYRYYFSDNFTVVCEKIKLDPQGLVGIDTSLPEVRPYGAANGKVFFMCLSGTLMVSVDAYCQ